jgi:amidase
MHHSWSLVVVKSKVCEGLSPAVLPRLLGPEVKRYDVRMKRRDFVATVSLGLAAGVPSLLENSIAAAGAAELPDPPEVRASSPKLEFATALDAAAAIRKKQISSVELTQQIFARIDKYNPKLNAFAYQLRDDALARAKQADQAQSAGKSLGVFHGVPIHVKESFAIAGHPCTWGIPALKDSRAPSNSEVVERLQSAGAVIIGATNVPINLGDWQSYNEIYGTTNNPWDTGRSPGGSSGGSAAALAAGLGYLSVGSDIGGSIRIPAHFCGIYGHKSSLDLVSQRGHLPGGAHENPGFSTLLAVAGPLARNADDLLAAIRILGGPDDYSAKAWKWELPASRHETLRDFRVGYVLDDPFCPVTADTKAALEKVIQSLEKAGAKLKPGWPAGFKVSELYDTYNFLLDAFTFSVEPPEAQEAVKKAAKGTGESVPGLAPFADWQAQNFRRLAFRAQWQKHFEETDVFLSPVAFTSTFLHDHSRPSGKRKIATQAGPRDYYDMLNWVGPPTLTGCPATVAPIGRGEAGLPIGIQIMGPLWEDATPITFASLLPREICSFIIPPGYGD